jgi:phosphatidylserine decarboxylase
VLNVGKYSMTIETLKRNLQYVLPHHFLSRSIAKLADCQIPLIKNALINLFVRLYKVDLSTATITKLSEYPSFNAFFTRALKESARPIAQGKNVVISPAEGTISQSGSIQNGKLVQTKGHLFSLTELLGGDQKLADSFQQGDFVTIYLAPHNYHRVHMPIDGKLMTTKYIPGRLFSVNSQSVAHIPNLFCRNERLISLFQTKVGLLAIILVGAMLVAGIETVWGQRESPCQSREILEKNYIDKNIFLTQGSEMGRFLFGSTVILLFPPSMIKLSPLKEQQIITMGFPLGSLLPKVTIDGNE